MVALLAEGVDRNGLYRMHGNVPGKSPSSRRAWIEISGDEGTDLGTLSPSSRRAWIEIPGCFRGGGIGSVALLAEGVDRNA